MVLAVALCPSIMRQSSIEMAACIKLVFGTDTTLGLSDTFQLMTGNVLTLTTNSVTLQDNNRKL